MRAEHRHKRSARRLQEKVDNWNASVPVGAAVQFRNDLGKIKDTTTRSEAWVLSGHSAVIMLEGVSGCYDLDRVSATPTR